MALKKGMFESYVKEREAPVVSRKPFDDSKYSHNRVFDEPESLKKALANQEISSVDSGEKNLEVTALPPSSISESTNSLKQALNQSEVETNLHWNNLDVENKKSGTNLTQTKHKLNTK